MLATIYAPELVTLDCYAIDLRKQKKLDADPKAIQQINFIGNLEEDNATIFFIIEEAKETVLVFHKKL